MSFLLFDRADYKVFINNSFSFQTQTFNSTTIEKEQLKYNVTFMTNNRTKDYDEISCLYFMLN